MIMLETERLYMREMTYSDYPALCKILQDDEVMYAYEGAFDDSGVREWLLTGKSADITNMSTFTGCGLLH